MKIILLKDKAKVGRAGEVKEVSDGFAMNALIPQGIAVKATPEKVKEIEIQRITRKEVSAVEDSLLAKNLAELQDKKISISRKANEKGHLYEEIHKEEISKIIKSNLHLDILPKFIELPHHMKEVGEFEIKAGKGDKSIKFKIEILASKEK